MPQHTDPVVSRLLDVVEDPTTDDSDLSTHVKTLKTYAEALKLLEPDPIPEPEPSGVKGFFYRHSGDLIKVAGTISVVGLIAVIEAKGDVIFRSKASKFI